MTRVFEGAPEDFGAQIFQTGFQREDGTWEFIPDNQLGTFYRLLPLVAQPCERWLVRSWIHVGDFVEDYIESPSRDLYAPEE